MASESKQIKQAVKALKRLQDKQAKSVKRVGILRGNLDKVTHKMETIEVKTAQLEQRVHGLNSKISKDEQSKKSEH
jgi:hypothetical protein